MAGSTWDLKGSFFAEPSLSAPHLMTPEWVPQSLLYALYRLVVSFPQQRLGQLIMVINTIHSVPGFCSLLSQTGVVCQEATRRQGLAASLQTARKIIGA